MTPKENRSHLFWTIVYLIVFTIILMSCDIPLEKTYLVRIEYCDGRSPKEIKITTRMKPENRQIRSHREAVPRYAGEVNVCNVTVIAEYK